MSKAKTQPRKATKAPAKKKSAPAKKAPAKKAPAKKAPAKKAAMGAASKPARRADFGRPVDSFFEKQPAALRSILEELKRLVESVAPDAESSIKWGMPFYSVGGQMMCALGAHKSHVNLILSGPPGTFADPEDRLDGAGSKTGRHLKLRPGEPIPVAAVRGWLRTAAELARSKSQAVVREAPSAIRDRGRAGA